MRRFEIKFLKGEMWGKVALLMGMLFFLNFGDAIISNFIPGYIQGALGGSLVMGIMMSFSSIVGFGADLIFPQLLKKASSRKMILLAISSVFITAGVLIWTTKFVVPGIFLLAMGTWGIYYEFLNFGVSQFVAKTAPVKSRLGVWSIMGVTRSVAYTVGPLVGSWLYIWKGSVSVILVYAIFALMAYIVWYVIGYKDSKKVKTSGYEVEPFNLVDEIGHWIVLFEHVWPILLVSLTLGIVDAAFWTTGIVLSDGLIKQNWIGSLFIPAYVFPSIFIGFILVKMGIYKGKKRLAIIYMLLTGIAMVAFGFTSSVYILILISLIIGVLTSFSWPFVDAVYSDILARMGREQKHMIGLSSSVANLSFIIGPVVAGFFANKIGEPRTLMFIGIFVVIVSVSLMFVTPKKLRLPQKEIDTWDRVK